MSEWQPIETAPMDTKVLIACWIGADDDHPTGWSMTVADKYRSDKGGIGDWSLEMWGNGYDNDGHPDEAPSHWMPLPEPPKSSANAGGTP